jgi:hypothetical protein
METQNIYHESDLINNTGNKNKVCNGLWTDKYKPSNISELICNKEYVEQITRLLNNNKKSTIIITGNHGIGKTCMVNTILKELNYCIKTINFNKIKQKNIEEILNSLIKNNNILSLLYKKENKSILVIDNLDSISSKTEINCINDIISTNDSKKIIPIILIGNNKHNKFISEIKKKATSYIKMKSPCVNDMFEIIKYISKKENMKWENDNVIINNFIPYCQQDIQRTLCLLQDLHTVYGPIYSKKISAKMIETYCDKSMKKDLDNDLWISSDKLISQYDGIDNILKNYDSDKVNLPLMIQQNYIKAINSPNIAKNISESLSHGDIIENYIYGNQNWTLYFVHGFYSCVLPSYMINSCRKKDEEISLSYPDDFYRTSIKFINKKNITNINESIPNLNINDHIYLNQIITHHINEIEECTKINDDDCENNEINNKDTHIQKISELFSGYNFNANLIDKLLKIDKTKNNKVFLSSKSKKEINKLLDA